jgi:hypothetical protein
VYYVLFSEGSAGSLTLIAGRVCVVDVAIRYGDRIPVLDEIFRTNPDRPWDPPSLLFNGYRFFPGSKTVEA